MISFQDILLQTPGCLAWKDASLNYLGANQNLLDAFGLEHLDQIIGANDAVLVPDYTEDMHASFQSQDMRALSGEHLEIIHALDVDDQAVTYFLKKSPMIRRANPLRKRLQELSKRL